jgi:NAD(P)-dependent dehydrogenase (short-subunit alcohol dehydrogenase family)
MRIADSIAVVTGAGSGIGAELARRFVAEGAQAVVLADRNLAPAAELADQLGERAWPVGLDVTDQAAVQTVVRHVLAKHGRIDLFCSNAGIAFPAGGVEAPNEGWQRIWDVNVMGHVYAARAVLPGMIARGEGYLLHTASAAGLLTNLGAAPYSATKHAVVGLAEWLAITHGDQGIKVSCLCPQGVRTNMLLEAAGGDELTEAGPANQAQLAGAVVLAQGAIEPEEVAEAVVAGLAAEQFLILPHPEVLDYFRNKAQDYDRWLGGMRKLQRHLAGPG